MSLFRKLTFTDWARNITVDEPGRFAPALVTLADRVSGPLLRLLHRPSLRGLENLPADGPYLLVANHSGGVAAAELSSFFTLWLQEFGTRRPLAGFTLPLTFHVFPFTQLLRAGGAIPSTYEAARQALAAGVPILVFPGGDHEVLRPVWQANRVDFGGRTGFLRIAAEAGIPIVPLGIYGSHYTAPILWRSKTLSRLLVLPNLIGLKRWALTVLGVAGAGVILFWPGKRPLGQRLLLAWLWLSSPLVFLPWVPWTIRMQIGEPLAIRDLLGEENSGVDEKVRFEGALASVEAAVQAELDQARLYREAMP